MFVKLTDNCVVDTTKVAAIYIRNREVVIGLVGSDPVVVVDPDKDLCAFFDEIVKRITTAIEQPEETVPSCLDCIYRATVFPKDICAHMHSVGTTCALCRQDPEMCGESGKWFLEGRVTPM